MQALLHEANALVVVDDVVRQDVIAVNDLQRLHANLRLHRNTKRDVTSFSNSAFVSTLHCSRMPCHSSSSATHYPSLFTSSPTFFDAPMGHFVSVTWMKSCTQSLSM